MLTISIDGLIHLTRAELHSIPLHHLLSGLDEHSPPSSHTAASPTQITGYTEWVSHTQPTLSLGWDWQLGDGTHPQRITRISPVHSNIIMLDDTAHTDTLSDSSPLQSEAWLAEHIEAIAWQTTVLQFITQRYK